MTATVQGVTKDGFADGVQRSADGKSAGKTGEGYAELVELICQIQRGAIAFSGGMHAEDDFADILFFHAVKQAIQIQFTGADVIQWAESAHQDVIHAIVLAGGFQLHNVAWLFDHENGLMITMIVGTNRAGVGICCVATRTADFQIDGKVTNCISQLHRLIARTFKQVKRNALC